MKRSALSQMYFNAGQLAFALGASGRKLELPPEVLAFAASPDQQKLRQRMLRLLYDAYLLRVPNISAEELLDRFEADNAHKVYANDLRGWNFFRRFPALDEGDPPLIPGPGLVYEWRLWTPGRRVGGKEAVAHAARDGWLGHTGAFIEWRRVNRMSGFFASVPQQDDCFVEAGSGFRFTVLSSAAYDDPCGKNVALELRRWALDMPPQTTYVEFREVKT